MAYEVPKYSRTQVDRSGRVLLDSDAKADVRDKAYAVVSNWRSGHAFPLNTIQMDLRKKATRINPDALVVQRLKRTRSILSKLDRETSMRLTQMQDIGGCRAVLRNISEIAQLRQLFVDSRAEHRFIEDYDYIENPKVSGYRGVHLVYGYKSKSKPEYNDLLFEIQLRTELQHAWATAVETVGVVLGQSLKASEGEASWLEFFKYAAMAFAHSEASPAIPGVRSSPSHVRSSLRRYMRRLDVIETLDRYRHALRATEEASVKDAGYFLLVLRPAAPTLEVIAYPKGKLDLAYKHYSEFELELPSYTRDAQLPLFPEFADYSGAQAVLVGAQSFRSLRRSYPNYYLDTQGFIDALEEFAND